MGVDLRRARRFGQINNPATLRKPLLGAFAAILLATGVGGCGNIYSRSQRNFSADPCVRLKARIAEAQAAGDRASEAAETLRDALSRSPLLDIQDANLDRYEVAARDFRRCVAAVRDTAVSCKEGGFHAETLAALNSRSERMVDLVFQIRETIASGDKPKLKVLLNAVAH